MKKPRWAARLGEKTTLTIRQDQDHGTEEEDCYPVRDHRDATNESSGPSFVLSRFRHFSLLFFGDVTGRNITLFNFWVKLNFSLTLDPV